MPARNSIMYFPTTMVKRKKCARLMKELIYQLCRLKKISNTCRNTCKFAQIRHFFCDNYLRKCGISIFAHTDLGCFRWACANIDNSRGNMDWSKATTYIHSNGKKRRTAFSLSLLKARRNMWGQWGFVPTYFRQKCTLTLYITSQNLGYLQCTEYILIFKFSKLLGDMNTPDELFKSETTLLIRGYRLSPRHLQHLI